MRSARLHRTAWLPALLVVLTAAAAPPLEAPSYDFPVQPVGSGLRLEYRPMKASYAFGSVLVGHGGTMPVAPRARDTGTLRLERVGEYLAMTVDTVSAPSGGKAAERSTLRLLLTPTGQLFDAVTADENGVQDSQDNRLLLAQFAQNFFLILPRFPAEPVTTGAMLYDYEWDFGRTADAPAGTFMVRVTGTVRGLSKVNGRSVVVVDYDGRGRCTCADLSYAEKGYELIDVATGVVSGYRGQARMDSPRGFRTWTFGVTIDFD